ncbi:mannose-1-phosphate guanylyltransferase/mannose-6-phosphate isomerase [Pleionea sediminis]|uniref:mannose-1-phosphate guanylyltransferase/mannose-6-phosphate isomerase n=1 Tax=Pleionea sediminis TaxID=2569479 RepID=UPI0011852DEF|nr:mannose-1-phosphate guanylyltransferase/mannose-6-phosphate isomerase [Pleionea sediminis]
MKLYPVILSGGAGTRLWPVSRDLFPKQLVNLTENSSLFQKTLERCELLKSVSSQFSIEPPVVVCNEQHRFLIAQQAQELGCELTSIILEPSARNTAPALTLASVFLSSKDPDALMLVLPADHAIEEPSIFAESIIKLSSEISQQASIGVFGIKPAWPHTGYGYIEATEKSGSEVFAVSSFKEKPDQATAESYLNAGNYFWNSGMFVTKASVWNQSIEALQPKILEACSKSMKGAQEDLDFVRVDQSSFEASPSDSIDYAVIENIESLKKLNISVHMISLDCSWTDLGAWSSVSDYMSADEKGNVSVGDVMQEDSTNTFVMSQERLVATLGVDNLVVVETPDAVLVANKDKAQDVKKIVARLKSENRDEHLVHRRVYRPWGNYETVDFGERYQVKRIVVNPGASLSLQMHHHRAEHWIVVHGTAEVTCDDKTFLLTENESTYIPIGSTHRLVNPGKFPLELVEVQSGSYLGEDDIVRFDDVYGRQNEKVIG